MIDVRPFAGLGQFQTDWLDAHHHFSFGHYYDPRRMGLGALRVWNDDTIRAGTGFDPHPHRDMEIITYVRQGAITHKDNTGNEGRTGAGDVQVMWAGNGILHSEYNMEDEDTRIFQIWIETASPGIAPGWTQRAFPRARDEISVLASGRDVAGHQDAPRIHQDAAILGAVLSPGATVSYPLIGRKAYVVADKGRISVNENDASARDGTAVSDVDSLTITAGPEGAEVVFADVA